MARHSRVKTSEPKVKIKKYKITIQHLLIINLILNAVTLYFVKFG